jgi:hypothetical protein
LFEEVNSALFKLPMQACKWTFVGDSVALHTHRIFHWLYIGQ